MTDGAPTLSVPEGVPAEEFAALLAAGKERGSLSPDEIVPVLKTVDLTPELIDAVVDRVRAEGINYEDPVVEAPDEPEDEPTVETAAVGQTRARRRLAVILGRVPDDGR